MIFAVLLAIVAAAVAAAAAYFSVYGLALLFSGIAVPVIIMGISLEAGKLMAASFLYRFWNSTSKFLKAYLMFAILILMFITSMGIFGFLTGAYQKQNLPLETTEIQLQLKQEELDTLLERKAAIDKQISDMPATYVSAKQRLIASFADEIETLNERIPQLQTEILEQKGQSIETEAKIGPILFVAETLGVDKSLTIFFFVLVIVLVFDPLAVALTIAANIAFAHAKKSDTLLYESPIENLSATPMAVPNPTEYTNVDTDDSEQAFDGVVFHDTIPEDLSQATLVDNSRILQYGDKLTAPRDDKNYVDIQPIV
jgi:hypothetical protein